MSIRGYHTIDVQRDVLRIATKCTQLLFEYFDPALMKLLRGDHAYLVLPRKIKIGLAVHLAPQSHLQKTVFPDQSFLDRTAERRAMRKLAPKIFVPKIVVSVELNHHQRPVFFGRGPQKRPSQGRISADGRTPRSRSHQRLQVLLDAPEGVFDGQWVHRKVAEVRDTILRERINLQHRVPRTDQHRLVAHLPRPKSRPRPVRRASVIRNSHQRDIQLLRVVDVRQSHERGDPARTRALQSVQWRRMRQLVLFRMFFHRAVCYEAPQNKSTIQARFKALSIGQAVVRSGYQPSDLGASSAGLT